MREYVRRCARCRGIIIFVAVVAASGLLAACGGRKGGSTSQPIDRPVEQVEGSPAKLAFRESEREGARPGDPCRFGMPGNTGRRQVVELENLGKSAVSLDDAMMKVQLLRSESQVHGLIEAQLYQHFGGRAAASIAGTAELLSAYRKLTTPILEKHMRSGGVLLSPVGDSAPAKSNTQVWFDLASFENDMEAIEQAELPPDITPADIIMPFYAGASLARGVGEERELPIAEATFVRTVLEGKGNVFLSAEQLDKMVSGDGVAVITLLEGDANVVDEDRARLIWYRGKGERASGETLECR